MGSEVLTATYRGYRLQALYVLNRVFTDEDAVNHVYWPEGGEDLRVDDLDGHTIEQVQVKSYTNPLMLSHFGPNEINCYFYRVHQSLAKDPNISNILASYSALGPELAGALAGNEAFRSEVVRKLVINSALLAKKVGTNSLKLSQSDVKRVLDNVRFVLVNEVTLTEALIDKLRPTIMGFDPDTALDLLLWWVFCASESGQWLTREEVQRKAREIGETLASLQSFHQEWERSIVGLRQVPLSVVDRTALASSFRQGDRSSWRHILAGVDVPRQERLTEIYSKLRDHNAVIIHGASGQGKSALGFRYMLEFCPELWRFHIKAVADRRQALNIATALNSHAKSLGIPAIIFLDVDPNDVGWTELVRQIAQNERLKLLVAVREEDYHRPQVDFSGLRVAEMTLDSLTEAEAREIYAGLTEQAQPTRVLDFNDAWQRFGAKGPLMEFTYLVTQGESLRGRLRNQVSVLQAEARKPNGPFTDQHIELLALVSVAAAYECRLNAEKLCKHLGLSLLTNPFAPFEREYLLRYWEELSIVSGLHPIRSEIVLEKLLESTPDNWVDYASVCLPLLLESDLEPFLLRAFSRQPKALGKLKNAIIALSEPSWEQVGGITRALLWLGLSNFEGAHRETIRQAIELVGQGWLFVFDGYVADSEASVFDFLQETLRSVNPGFEKLAGKFSPPNKALVFQPFREWAREFRSQVRAPTKEVDWLGLGIAAFWLGSLSVSGGLVDQLEAIGFNEGLQRLNLETLGAVVIGMWQTQSQAFRQWHTQNIDALRKRFLNDTKSLTLELKDKEVHIAYILELSLLSQAELGNEQGNIFNAQTMRRINLVSELFPGQRRYCCRGLGLDALPVPFPSDPTLKEIPAANIFPLLKTDLNGTFNALVVYRHLRPVSWEDYIKRVVATRRDMAKTMAALVVLLDKVLKSEQRELEWQAEPAIAWVCKRAGEQSEFPELPQCAVDEWGFTSDSRVKASPSATRTSVTELASLPGFASYKKAARDFTSGLSYFFTQFAEGMRSCLALRVSLGDESVAKSRLGGEQAYTESQQKSRMCLINLAFALEVASDFQKEFRTHFGNRIPTVQLEDLERSEKRSLSCLWAISCDFIRDPSKTRSNPVEHAEAIHHSNRNRFLSLLRTSLAALQREGIEARLVSENSDWSQRKSLWITASTRETSGLERLIRSVASAVSEAVAACRFRGQEALPIAAEWKHVVVVPQFRRRSLAKVASAIPLRHFIGAPNASELSPVFTFCVPVEELDWVNINLPLWTVPVAGLTLKWFEALHLLVIQLQMCFPLFAAATHYSVFPEVIRQHEERFTLSLSEVINGAYAAYEQLRDFLAMRLDSSLSSLAQGREILGRLKEWAKTVFPQEQGVSGTIMLDFERFATWINSMSIAAQKTPEIFADILECFVSKS
jgi:hypothetical protein